MWAFALCGGVALEHVDFILVVILVGLRNCTRLLPVHRSLFDTRTSLISKGDSGVLHGDEDFGNMMYTDLGRKWEDSIPTGKIPSTFNILECQRESSTRFVNLYAYFFRREDTGFRKAVPQEKRMAIVLYWLAHAPSFSTLTALFGIGKATALSIVHTGVQALRRHMVSSSIRFPTDNELSQGICNFEALCHLPQCAGALDGTFMKIEKSDHFGDAYYC